MFSLADLEGCLSLRQPGFCGCQLSAHLGQLPTNVLFSQHSHCQHGLQLILGPPFLLQGTPFIIKHCLPVPFHRPAILHLRILEAS